jgi:hypothetical protein
VPSASTVAPGASGVPVGRSARAAGAVSAAVSSAAGAAGAAGAVVAAGRAAVEPSTSPSGAGSRRGALAYIV